MARNRRRGRGPLRRRRQGAEAVNERVLVQDKCAKRFELGET